MLSALFKDPNAGRLDCFRIELTEHVEKNDVKDVSRAVLAFDDSRICARVELLSNLNIERNTADRRRDRNTEFSNASDHRCNKIYRWFISGTKVDLNRLKPAAAVGNRDINAHGIDKFQVAWNFHAERELIKSQRGSALKRRKPVTTATAGQADVHVLCSAGPIGESQFKRRTTLEMVVSSDAFVDRSLEHAAYREERDPTAQPEFVDVGLSRNAVKSFIEPLTRHLFFSIPWLAGDFGFQ
jgi:hypothetical protein